MVFCYVIFWTYEELSFENFHRYLNLFVMKPLLLNFDFMNIQMDFSLRVHFSHDSPLEAIQEQS